MIGLELLFIPHENKLESWNSSIILSSNEFSISEYTVVLCYDILCIYIQLILCLILIWSYNCSDWVICHKSLDLFDALVIN